jgi:hypothetical protein
VSRWCAPLVGVRCLRLVVPGLLARRAARGLCACPVDLLWRPSWLASRRPRRLARVR